MIMSYQRVIFVPGERYRAKQTFTSGNSQFISGEVLAFERDFYSRYDSSFVYEFRSENDGTNKTWWLHDQKPVDIWREYFEPATS
jgi:hypothetical protein